MFKKKQKIKVTAYSPSDGLIKLFPLKKNSLPDWFRKLSKKNLDDLNHKNVRVCSGLTDLYNNSISIPAWQDMEITINPDASYELDVPNHNFSAVSHPIVKQAPGAWPEYINIKLLSPWLIVCNKDVQWTMIQAVWNQKLPMEQIVVPGNLEFKYQNVTNINLLYPIPKKEPKKYKINAGDIIALLVPNFSDDYEIQFEYASQETYNRIRSNRWAYTQGMIYAKLRTMLRKKDK